jgi:hypothetical protein
MAQAAEPTGTLTLACKGEKLSGSSSGGASGKGITGQEQISLGIVVNFTAHTISFGSEWPDAIPIQNLTETAITFKDQYKAGASIFGNIDRVTGDAEAKIDHTSAKYGQVIMTFSLKCKPMERMF